MTAKKPPFFFLPFVLYIIAVIFLTTLVFTINEDVFFSGDAGLKFLMVKQIAKGRGFTTLNLEAPSWVKNVWSQGFYPFREPFVYETPRGKVVSFPPAFQWLSSFFYNCFGFKGLYFVPHISIMTLWLWLILLMKRMGAMPLTISLGFILVAFCSPLTIYGACYWEHSIAILLFFGAIAFLAIPAPSAFNAVLLGLMAGTSVWFRPEMILLCMLFLAASVYNCPKQKIKSSIVFFAMVLGTVMAFFIFNNSIYGNILGAHSYQLSSSSGLIGYCEQKLVLLFHLNARLIIYFPITILVLVLIAYFIMKRIPLTVLEKQLTVIVMAFLLMIPFALPNGGGKQWGPRYLLPAIPLLIILLCAMTHRLNLKFEKRIVLLLLPIMLYSSYLNIYVAHQNLQNDYAYRVKPGVDFLKKESCNIIVVQNQFIAQEFAALFDGRIFFLAEDQQAFNNLHVLLKDNGVSKIMYVSHDRGFTRLPVNLFNDRPELEKIGDYYFAEYKLE